MDEQESQVMGPGHSSLMSASTQMAVEASMGKNSLSAWCAITLPLIHLFVYLMSSISEG